MTQLEFRRSSEQVALRAAEDGASAHFSGFACVYDFWYDVAGGPERGGWSEMVAAGAGTATLKRRPDVRLLVNHDGIPLARTSRQTMTLDEQQRGLYVDAPELDLRRSPLVQSVHSAMDRGDMDEMSFAFRVDAQEWNGDYTERIILGYDLAVKGADVSIVTYPANDATVAQMRTAAQIDELRAAVACGLDVRVARHIVDRIRESSLVPA